METGSSNRLLPVLDHTESPTLRELHTAAAHTGESHNLNRPQLHPAAPAAPAASAAPRPALHPAKRDPHLTAASPRPSPRAAHPSKPAPSSELADTPPAADTADRAHRSPPASAPVPRARNLPPRSPRSSTAGTHGSVLETGATHSSEAAVADVDANTDAHADADAASHEHAHTDVATDADADVDSHAPSHARAHTDADTDADADADADADVDSDTASHAESHPPAPATATATAAAAAAAVESAAAASAVSSVAAAVAASAATAATALLAKTATAALPATAAAAAAAEEPARSFASLLAATATASLTDLHSPTAWHRSLTALHALSEMLLPSLLLSAGGFLLALAAAALKTIFWTLALALFGVWWAQGLILYMPSVMGRSGERRQIQFNPAGARTPAEQGMPYEEFFLRTADGVMIHAWFLPQPQAHVRATCPTVLYFHGNAGNIGNLLVNCRQMHQYLRCNTLIIEYRGYGNSQGSPSEHGLRLDALAGVDFAEKLGREGRIAADRLFVFGRSLGGAVAIWLASQRPDALAGLIVENTFTSIEDMAIVLLSRFAPPGRLERPLRAFLHLFMTSHWRSIDLVSTLQVPALFICGLADELVPPVQMRALYNAMPGVTGSEKFFHGVHGGEHNTTFFEGGQPYYDAYAKFILRYSRKHRTEE